MDAPEQIPSDSINIGRTQYRKTDKKNINDEKQEKLILNTCSTIMSITAQSGASRKEHQYKARNKTTGMTDYVENKITTSSTTSWKTIFFCFK